MGQNLRPFTQKNSENFLKPRNVAQSAVAHQYKLPDLLC